MKTTPILLLLAALALPAARAAAPAAAPAKPAPAAPPPSKPQEISLRMLDGLRFDPPRFEVRPGAEVVVKLHNDDTTHQIHNWLLVEPGKREAIVQAALELGDEAERRAFVPDTPLVLAHSGLLAPEAREKVSFRAPEKPGVYPFVCTFPGHGFVMYGAMYAGEKPPPLAKDPHLPPTASGFALAGGGRRPFIQRMFLPDAGPAAIAVALPNDLNACWDAGACRIRYVWSGAFLDASKYWESNGRHLGEPLGPVVWSAPKDHAPFGAAAGAPSFRGYRVEAGLPVFLYESDGARVEEKWTAEGGDLRIAYRVTAGPRGTTFAGPGLAGVGPLAVPAGVERVLSVVIKPNGAP